MSKKNRKRTVIDADEVIIRAGRVIIDDGERHWRLDDEWEDRSESRDDDEEHHIDNRNKNKKNNSEDKNDNEQRPRRGFSWI
ncbi:hypothetical protein CU633_21040 [Bacillus sp. V3-13]|uniref:hypothetical protein n=1 Tax=Bacillus sp. V3-13 TaxID=2053728 RepID=UPI000C773953|nr:hypothetical protein [Bacillus sp. V3-13]PLR75450.1 hypothetical protein CU633_21040 [Bacillus sp. V3-13]